MCESKGCRHGDREMRIWQYVGALKEQRSQIRQQQPFIMDNKPIANCCKKGWRVCMVVSIFTLPAEGNYAPAEGELLGITYALNKTKYFTLGGQHLHVGTDHNPLLGILNGATLDSMDNQRILN